MSCRWFTLAALLVILDTPASAQDLDAGVDISSDAGVDAPAAVSDDTGVDAPVDATLDADLSDAPLSADAAVIDAASTDAGPTPTVAAPSLPHAPEGSGNFVLTLLGLVALITLAWLGGHEKLRRFEERLGISQVVTSGFPFVLLGVLARAPGIDILTDDVLRDITPVLQFGLGWIGFHTGFQLDSRATNETPRGTATLVILLTAVPFLLITGTSGAVMWGLGLGTDVRQVAADAVMLGVAGALSAPTAERLKGTRTLRAIELLRTVGMLDDIVGVATFACLAAFLHPPSEQGWQLPGVGWVFVTFGMAVVLGLITYTALRGTDSTAEKTSLLLGAVCLTTGFAGTFSLAPLVVCFLAGVLLRNLPGDDKRQLEEAFGRLERPIYHLFLVIVGALWRPETFEGWVLLPVFVLARAMGRWGGARAARNLPGDARPEALRDTSDVDLVAPPMGQLAIAFVITAQTLHASSAVRAMVTAVVIGGIVTEIIVQLVARRGATKSSSAAAEVELPPALAHDDEDDA